MKKIIQSWDDEVLTKVEEHEGRKYYLESAMSYIVDDYDEYLGSVELSHYERLDYYELKDYSESSTNPEVLDLRWMSDDDTIDIDKKESNSQIKKVLININNLDCSHLKDYDGFSNLELVIYNKQTNLTPIQKIRILTRFLSSNQKSISTITFIGFNPVFTTILNKYASRYIPSQEEVHKLTK